MRWIFFLIILSTVVTAHGEEGGYFSLVDIELYLVFALAIVASYYAFNKSSYLGTSAASIALVYLVSLIFEVFRLSYLPEDALLHVKQILGIVAMITFILGVKELK